MLCHCKDDNFLAPVTAAAINPRSIKIFQPCYSEWFDLCYSLQQRVYTYILLRYTAEAGESPSLYLFKTCHFLTQNHSWPDLVLKVVLHLFVKSHRKEQHGCHQPESVLVLAKKKIHIYIPQKTISDGQVNQHSPPQIIFFQTVIYKSDTILLYKASGLFPLHFFQKIQFTSLNT